MWLWHYMENPSRGFFDAQAHHPAITKAQVKHCDVVTAFSAHHLSGCFRKHCWPSDTNQRKPLWLSDILCITLPPNRHTHTHTLEELTFRIALQVGKISNRASLHIADNVHTSFVWREWFLLSHWQACLFCPETPGTVKHPAVQLVLHLLLSQLAGWPPTSISLSPLFVFLTVSQPSSLHQQHLPLVFSFSRFRSHKPHFSRPPTSKYTPSGNIWQQIATYQYDKWPEYGTQYYSLWARLVYLFDQ